MRVAANRVQGDEGYRFPAENITPKILWLGFVVPQIY
jgi:hypothetical protein